MSTRRKKGKENEGQVRRMRSRGRRIGSRGRIVGRGRRMRKRAEWREEKGGGGGEQRMWKRKRKKREGAKRREREDGIWKLGKGRVKGKEIKEGVSKNGKNSDRLIRKTTNNGSEKNRTIEI